MRIFLLPLFFLAHDFIYSQSYSAKEESGQKPGIIINGILCKILNQEYSCVTRTCSSVEICEGDSISFCTDPYVNLTTDTAYWIKWKFPGSNFPDSIINAAPTQTPVCYEPKWTTAGSYTVDIFYNGWLSAYPGRDCYPVPSHWEISVSVCPIGGTEEISQKNFVTISPNPTSGNLRITFATANPSYGGNLYEYTNYELEIYNMYGEKIYSSIINHSASGGQLSIVNLNSPSGIYFLKIFTNDAKFTINKKVMVIGK